MALPDLSGLASQLGGLLPSNDSLIKGLVGSAVLGVVGAGLKSEAGQNSVDPLHLIFHPQGSVQATTKPTISAAAFGALPADARAQLLAQGVAIL